MEGIRQWWTGNLMERVQQRLQTYVNATGYQVAKWALDVKDSPLEVLKHYRKIEIMEK